MISLGITAHELLLTPSDQQTARLIPFCEMSGSLLRYSNGSMLIPLYYKKKLHYCNNK